MKKCPNCQKEFPDTMRFCQTDGTPLVDAAETQNDDPLKTTVVRQEDIASSIPPADPYKTVVGSGISDDSGDLLQLPEEDFDPLKTMVAQPIGQNKPVLEDKPSDTPKFEEIKKEIKPETPSSSFGGFSQPSEPLPVSSEDISTDPTVLQPEPPKFNEPSLSPPSFGNLSAKDDDEDLPQTVMQNPWDSGSSPQSDQSPYKNDSPFSKPNNDPIPTPFDVPSLNETKLSSDEEPSKSTFDEPQTPFGQQSSSPFGSPFDAPKESSFNEPQSYNPPTPSFQEPSNQASFGQSQFDQINQGFGNQPLQQNDWTPPTPPEASWQDKGLGANTPFQPPVAGAGGQNQTLAIISLVCGILSCLCCFSVITGPAALVMGFMAKGKATNDPANFGGAGLALGGMITGAIGTLLGIVVIILQLMGALANIGR